MDIRAMYAKVSDKYNHFSRNKKSWQFDYWKQIMAHIYNTSQIRPSFQLYWMPYLFVTSINIIIIMTYFYISGIIDSYIWHENIYVLHIVHSYIAYDCISLFVWFSLLLKLCESQVGITIYVIKSLDREPWRQMHPCTMWPHQRWRSVTAVWKSKSWTRWPPRPAGQ